MRRFLSTLCLLAAVALPMLAADRAPADGLELHLKDQRTVQFKLAESPQVRFVNDELTLEMANQTVAYPMAEVSHIKFVTYNGEEGVKDIVAADVEFEIDDNTVTVRSLDAGATVSVYNLQGLCVATGIADSEGCVCLDLSTFGPGVYIINAENTSYKLIKH